VGAQVTIPLGGNAFITQGGDDMNVAMITDTGLEHWRTTETICSVYFKLSQKETFTLSLQLSVPSGSSKVKVSIHGKASYTKTITGTEKYIQAFGKFKNVGKGYVKLNIRGISKEGDMFGNVFNVLLAGTKGTVEFISNPMNFYFGRRGPSVHMSYEVPNPYVNNYEYFYSEVTVPVGNDVVGSYFMANGFKNGYFGMQVNSATQRSFLFSVFSDDPSDNVAAANAALQVSVLKAGPGVTTNTFGNEGNGQQAYYYMDWQAGQTYKYLVYGSPSGPNATKHTGWIKVPGGDWMLMASYLKPTTPGYLTRQNANDLYSFCENFIPDQGYITRMATYGNQWVRNTYGIWSEVIRGYFDSDATASNGRDDYAGGVTSDNRTFFLKIDGFFNDMVAQYQYFDRTPGGISPAINITSLP